MHRYDELGLEANVELQRVARRLKDENDALKNLLINLGHGNMIPSALESVYQNPQTPTGGAGPSHSLLNFDSRGPETAGSSGSGARATRSGMAMSTKSTVSSSASSSAAMMTSNMGPPTHTATRQRGMSSLTSNQGFSSRPLEHSASAQSDDSSIRGGDESESSHAAFNPPELLHRSALSSSAASSLLDKLGTGMVAIPPSATALSQQDDRRASAAMAHHIDAAINKGRTGSVPSLLRLDLGSQNANANNMSGRPDQRQLDHDAKAKAELPTSQASMPLGPFGSMGLSVPPAPGSSTAAVPSSATHIGPIVSYGGSGNANFLPFVQPTSVNEALLNPNPIPFQFNLSQLSQAPTGISPMRSFSSLADQGTWWLSAGGASLTPGQDPNALDEKAQAVAAEQQQQQQQSQQQHQQAQQGWTRSGSQTTDGQEFDLSAFLNGGVTPGGSFKMDGNTAISGHQSSQHSTLSNTNINHSPRQDSGSAPVGSDRGLLDRWEDKMNTNSSSSSIMSGNNIGGDQSRRNTVTHPEGGDGAAESASLRRPSTSAMADELARGSKSLLLASSSSASSPSPAQVFGGAAYSPQGSAKRLSSSSSSSSAAEGASPPSASPSLARPASSSSSSSGMPHSAQLAAPSPSPAPSTWTRSSADLAPAINMAKQMLLDGAVPASSSSSSAAAAAAAQGGAMAALNEGYPSINVPLKRTLSNALGTHDSTASQQQQSSPSSAFVPPTKIFRAAAPGALGSAPIGFENVESTRAFLQLLEQRMARADGGLGTVGLYEHLGFRPPSFVASAGASTTSGGGDGAAGSSSSQGGSGGASVMDGVPVYPS